VFAPLARTATVAVVVLAAGCSAEVTRFNLNLLGGYDTTTGTIPPPSSWKGKEDAFGYKAPPKGSQLPPPPIAKKLADLNPQKDYWREPPKDGWRDDWREPPKDYYRQPPKDHYQPPKDAWREPPGPPPPPAYKRPELKSDSKVEPPPGKQPPSGTTVEVQPGDTLYSIARRHGVTASALKELNGLTSTSVRPGQRLLVPSDSRERGPLAKADPFAVFDKGKSDPPGKAAPPAGEATSAKLTGTKEATKEPPPNQPPRVVQVKPRIIRVEEEPKADARIKTVKRTDTATDAGPPPVASSRFRWPLRGKLIVGFGVRSNGAKSDGVNLAASLGAEVRAADSGRVHYVGALKGYGNMVLIRHADDWATAYGYVDQIQVKVNDEVKRGQVIAKVAKGGPASQPQLKFELRKASVPVDPLAHLPD
jgi:murein DD-endopeptidase MepM/ murein hydrolase activator NlpD